MSSFQRATPPHDFMPRSDDSDPGSTTTISVFAVLGGLLFLLLVLTFVRYLVWKLRSNKARQGRKDPEAQSHEASRETEETSIPSSNRDDLARECVQDLRSPLRRIPTINEAIMHRVGYRVLQTSSEAENHRAIAHPAAPNSPVPSNSRDEVVEREAEAGLTAHPPELPSQPNSPQQTEVLPEASTAPVSTGRTMSLMQREIDELRARVDELTRRQQPELTRPVSAATSSCSGTAPPSYREVGEHGS